MEDFSGLYRERSNAEFDYIMEEAATLHFTGGDISYTSTTAFDYIEAAALPHFSGESSLPTPRALAPLAPPSFAVDSSDCEMISVRKCGLPLYYGLTYTGFDFFRKLCGVSFTRSCESKEDAVRACMAMYRGAGMENKGNSCFAIAIIQCLVHTAIFFQYIVSDSDHNLQCICDGHETIFCLLHCLKRLFHELTSGKEHIWASELLHNLPFFDANDSTKFHISKGGHPGKFFNCFMDKIEKHHDKSSTSDYKLGDLFKWHVASKVRCFNCHRNCSEDFHLWQFPILYGFKDKTLENALERIMLEKIKEDCRACHMKSFSKCEIISGPGIAVFKLEYKNKRGKKVKRGQRRRQKLSYPMVLDLTRFSSGKMGLIEYDLYAIIKKKMYRPRNGHVYTLARIDPNTWFEFDEDKVSRVENIDKGKALMLFYAKRGSPWFSDVILKHMILKEIGQLTRLRHARRRRDSMWRPLSLFSRTLRRRSQ